MADTQLDFDFVLIPAGAFIIGSAPGINVASEPDETPQHTLTLAPFHCARFPVTNAQYHTFVAATEHRAPQHWQAGQMPTDKADHPVVGVSFHDCIAFCAWASAQLHLPIRLPTEPQWEKAARGTDGRIYPWGNRWDANRCNSNEAKWRGTSPVARFSPDGDSPFGIADMVGNVSEWCFSMFSRYPYRADDGREELHLADGRKLPWGATWGLQTTNEPSRFKGNEQRVLRGGSYRGNQSTCRCAYRSWAAAIHRSEDTGFRVVYQET